MHQRYLKAWIAGALVAFASSVVMAQRTDSLIGGVINMSKVINPEVEAQSLNAKVNSAYIESGPVLTKDGKRLYFSRHGHPNNTGGIDDQDIWFSEFDEATQSWTEAENLGAPLNNQGPNFICGVGWKGDTVLLGNVYSKKGKVKAGISLSIKTGDLWSFPVPVYVSNDYNLSDNVAYDLSHDRNSLLIAQQKVDSHGKLDLYVAFRDPNAKHPYAGTESINLGPTINTFGNETSPFLAYDGVTLYFSSDGHNGYGGYDVYVTKRLDRTWTNWSKPENLGPGINTPYDDSYFGFTPNNRFAYYSRGLSPSNSDIYQVDMTYLFKSNGPAQMKENDNSANVGQTTVINQVFTDNSADINNAVMSDLDRVAKYMQLQKSMIMLISAHSNKHASREESLRLSVDRANKVMNYLIKNGVEKGRLSCRGFGHDVLANLASTATTSSKDAVNDIASSVEFRYVGTAK
jgi:outer membrane protein OmpA-like peptidoglycan-associated protein